MNLTHIVMPDFTQNNSCNDQCGTGTAFDTYTEVPSHELFETASDPYGLGWLDDCTVGQEKIADICSAYAFHVPRRTATTGTPARPNRWAMTPVLSLAAFNPVTAVGRVVTDATTLDCTAGVVPDHSLDATLELAAPWPNPTSEGARIRYTPPFASAVRLSVVDIAGRRVAVLGQQLASPGPHDARWDGRDANGGRVPAGVYFVRLESAGQARSSRVVIER